MQPKEFCLSPGYWRSAIAEARNLRRLVLCAMFCALAVAVSSIYIVVGENLYVYFTCYINAVACAVCGPVLALLYAVAADTLNFFLFTRAGYFPGYLLSECLGCLIYALFLYRRTITVTRLFGAKLLVNYGVNVGLGSLWSSILYGKGYLYYLLKSLIKNTILLPFEVILMAALFALLIPSFSRFGLLPAMAENDRSKLKLGRSIFTVFGLDFLLCAAAAAYYAAALSGGTVFYGIAAAAAVAGVVCLAVGLLRRKKTEQ
jgi:ECF transporter S component (folate family)